MDLTQEENQIRVYALFDKVLSEINSRKLFVFDFDGLLIPGHLSRDVMHATQSKEARDKILRQYPDNTFEALEKLNVATLEGIPYEKALEIKKKVVDETPWRKDAVAFLEAMIHNKEYSALVISCGRYTPIRMKLDSAGLQQIPAMAAEVAYFDGKPVSKHIITKDLKGEFIKCARQKGKFERILAVGHGKGDIPMLQQADLGIVLEEDPPNTKVEKIADVIIDGLNELYFILEFKG